ncbi:hypothetical protein [Gluconobacter sp. P1C6_b]|uniref:hypothetical protein n=1 Tax=Gluconobacter sp. P1C6_b TaxID=2762619 RepID=UPI001C044F67|nr:hypothetical protein [Gluconobacter sp. P1C6_b]
MTTIVIDLNSKIIAADSRTSADGCDNDEFLIFIDDRNEDKIIYLKKYGLIFCCAGHGPTDISWKKWLRNETECFPAYPPKKKKTVDGITSEYIGAIIAVIDLNKLECKIILGDERLINYSINNDAIFIGTGRRFAQEEWEESYDAIKSIKFASEKDIKTGGEIKYFKFDNYDNNLSQIRINHCATRRLFRKEGRVVYKTNINIEIAASVEAKRNPKIEERLSKQDDLAATMDPNSDYPTSASTKPVWPECEKVRVEKLLRRLMPDRFQ